MLDLWKMRQKTHQKQMFKYLRYVLNDHFILALLFILGGLALSYSNYLKALSPQAEIWYAKPLVLLILVISLQVGRLATLLKPADIVFISPRQAEMGQYLQKALQSSLIFAWVFDTLVMLALTPFSLVAAKLTVVQLIFLWLLLLVLKYLQLERKLLGLYQVQFASGRWKWFLDIGFCGLLLGTSLYLDPLYLLLVAALLTGYIDKSKKALTTQAVFNWEVAIETENERMLQLYRFFALFTDVPNLQVAAKRRRYLDRLLPQAKPGGSFTYLYWRALVRNGETSGLVLRLTVLGAVILYFITEPWLALALAVLFVYLLGFQLFSLYHHYDEVVFMHIYPLDPGNKQKAFQKMLGQLLFVIAVIFTLVSWIQLQNILFSLEFLGVLVLEIVLLTRPYLKGRLAKRA
ncbi:ABC transporter permease [Ligilactobacillus murinus]|uniref:ABC transporter permease n=1 Tax=Ligilactobacillus murinus TaxID=1622 RepID=UPI001094B0D6|nr:ABC transporter permease [Ligilactobacillus murinus]TGY52811.1 ABC transporter permease [Ligilactobacillus murinus]